MKSSPKSAVMFLLLVVSVQASAQHAGAQQITRDDLYTDGLLNGRGWKLLDVDGLAKAALIQGIRGGLALATREAGSTGVPTNEKFKKQMFMLMGGNMDDVVQQLDDFYKDSANVRIPVPTGLEYSLMKLGGANARELDNRLVSLRREFNPVTDGNSRRF
jgi:hypothetical protein